MSARQVASESSEDEYFSVGAQAYGGADTSDSDADSVETTSMAPPRHPVPAMQGAFEESIHESSEPNPQPRSKDETAETRRQRILESRQYDDSWTARWKQRPTARHHPLAKLMAQIVFGMHLLQQQAAKSDEEVVKILQTHVDEVDNFLEKTTEDFDLAIKDISERINFLKLPMDHPDVFGTMLEDKAFRTQLMEGNEKIEIIIERTSRAMNAALLDIQRGKTATKELGHYLNAVSDDWPSEKADLEAVLNAMRGNEQGWKHCLKDLQHKAHELRDSMDQLSTTIREMARMAAEASRRTRAHGRASSSVQPPMSSIPRSKFSSDAANQRSRAMSVDKPDASSQRSRAMSVDKPLPKAPINTNGPVELEAHPVPMERRYEEPRPTPVSPERIERERSRRSSTVPPRPLTAGMKPRESRNMNRNDTKDIVEFLQEARQPSPLQSNPSGEREARNARNTNRQSAIDVVEHARSISRSSMRSRRDERPQTADGNTALGSGSEPARTEPYRKGIERNKHGPPPAGGRDSSRRSSSIGYVSFVQIPSLTITDNLQSLHAPPLLPQQQQAFTKPNSRRLPTTRIQTRHLATLFNRLDAPRTRDRLYHQQPQYLTHNHNRNPHPPHRLSQPRPTHRLP